MEKKIATVGSPSSTLADVGKYLVLAILLIVFATVVANIFAYAYATHFLNLPIVLENAKPSVLALATAALWVVVINGLLECIPRLRPIAVVRRVYSDGIFCAFRSATPGKMIAALLAIYVIAPVLFGELVANTQTSFRVMKLYRAELAPARADVPRRVLNEAIIVARTARGGVLLALYDRVRKSVVPNVEIVDDFGPYDAKLYNVESLGHINKESQ
jgi:hypothetical protein